MITVPAGSSLTLRCPGTQAIVLVSLAEVRAPFLAELPPIPVLSLDGPGVRAHQPLGPQPPPRDVPVPRHSRHPRVTP